MHGHQIQILPIYFTGVLKLTTKNLDCLLFRQKSEGKNHIYKTPCTGRAKAWFMSIQINAMALGVSF